MYLPFSNLFTYRPLNKTRDFTNTTLGITVGFPENAQIV